MVRASAGLTSVWARTAVKWKDGSKATPQAKALRVTVFTTLDLSFVALALEAVDRPSKPSIACWTADDPTRLSDGILFLGPCETWARVIDQVILAELTQCATGPLKKRRLVGNRRQYPGD